MRSRPAIFSLLLAIAGPLVADDVYLTNGKVYEGVVAEVVAGGVRIELPFGQLVLPSDQVERIERSVAPLEVFREAERSLRETEAGADAWLQLAGWAEENGLSHGARQATLRAAELDPVAEGLAPRMRQLGQVFDSGLGRWLTEEEFHRGRGRIRLGEEWVTPAEYQAHRDAEREAWLVERERAVARALEEASERLEREREAVRQREETLQALALLQATLPGYPVSTVVVATPPHRPGRFHQPPPREAEREPAAVTYRRLANRQPGSFIPVAQSPPRPATSTRAGHGGAAKRTTSGSPAAPKR